MPVCTSPEQSGLGLSGRPRGKSNTHQLSFDVSPRKNPLKFSGAIPAVDRQILATVEVRQMTGTATSLMGNYPFKSIMKHDIGSVT